MAGVIGAVVFDVGECLADETREYETWADWLGGPRHVFSALFGAVIARGQDYRDTFQVFQPGFDLDKARQQRADEGKPECSERPTCTPMCGPPWPGSATRACGSASQGTRRRVRAASCETWVYPPI